MSVECRPRDEELVVAARGGDQLAWEQIVSRYTGLINKIGHRYRLDDADVADVRQQVWIRLVQYADRLRTPAALPGWIATTATHACLAVLKHHRRQLVVDCAGDSALERQDPVGAHGDRISDDVTRDLIRAENCRAVRLGLAELTSQQRNLLLLLVADPPLSYQQISQRTGMPRGSIGPTRARLLRRLGRSRALLELTEQETSGTARVA